MKKDDLKAGLKPSAYCDKLNTEMGQKDQREREKVTKGNHSWERLWFTTVTKRASPYSANLSTLLTPPDIKSLLRKAAHLNHFRLL